MRGGFCGGRTGASGRLRESRGQEPEDKLRFVRREKELLRRGYAGGQGTTDETDRHGSMHGRFDVGVRSQGRLGRSRLQRGVSGAGGERTRRGGFLGKELREDGGQAGSERVGEAMPASIARNASAV